MHDKSFVPFTKEMKKDYTILVPNMLPMHFRLMVSVFKTYGYKMELLDDTGADVAEVGLEYTHNDTCYPAILVVGQFIKALRSGKYNPDKTALIMSQTGGGCRASNYISLIRKALKKAGFGHVPVISFSITGLEDHPGFRMSLKKLHGLMYAVLYGDLMMHLVGRVRPYEIEPGSATQLAEKWTRRLGRELGAEGKICYKHVKENYKAMVEEFAAIPMQTRNTVQVGVVGEIFVKYSPLANNNLEDFLVSEGAEVTVPGLLDFCLYCVYNSLVEYRVYKRKKLAYPFVKWAYKKICQRREDLSRAVTENSMLSGFMNFEKVPALTEGIISTAVKMGEGWLLTAEMLELCEEGCTNIVCTQPFGCLPNHICGKGMMKPIKARYPHVNIVAIDYDAGASRVNQENRIKLMLANARKEKAERTAKKTDPETMCPVVY
ncbi:MAG: 2-hydroxyglutaryl-CoA dehydratase [Ruminococcaceae bacterium]|nr:2-hydroxyglutaryl-CoA dehydratase [Oscillospiraceae bacterium]